MKNLFLTLALVFSGTLFCQDTNVTITLKGEKDSMCMFMYISPNIHGGYTYQATDFPDGRLFKQEKDLKLVITEPGGYGVTMNSLKHDKTTVVHIIVEEGGNYEIVQRVRGKNLHL